MRLTHASDQGEIVLALLDAGLGVDDIAVAARVSTDTVWRLASGGSGPRNLKDIDDLRMIALMLSDTGMSPELVINWLRSRCDALAGQTPISALASGEFAAVAQASTQLIAGPSEGSRAETVRRRPTAHTDSTPATPAATPAPPDATTSEAAPSNAWARGRVFLCHSSGDKPGVRKLERRLRKDGIPTWLDERELLPGQEWDLAIREAVRAASVVIVCLSRSAVTKAGYVQKEIRYVLDVADEQPEGSTFLIPARLEECEVPERLARWHWVDLYRRGGYNRLIEALCA